MLHTLDAHRRCGFAAMVVRHLSRQIIQDGRPAFCFIICTNDASNALFTGLGFEVTNHVSWIHAVGPGAVVSVP